MNLLKHLREKGREYYSNPIQDSCLGDTIFTKKGVLWGMNIWGRVIYLFSFVGGVER